MSDLLSEPRISINALAKRVNVHPSAVYRWRSCGCQGHRLETFLVGGRRYTTLPAFDRWVAKLNGADGTPDPIPAGRKPDVAAAERELDDLLNQ